MINRVRHFVLISAFLCLVAPGCYGWQFAPKTQNLEIGDILGLDAELTFRPSRGLKPLAPNRLLMIGEDGLLRTVEGEPTTCVTADGHGVPCVIASGGHVADGTSAQGVGTRPPQSSPVVGGKNSDALKREASPVVQQRAETTSRPGANLSAQLSATVPIVACTDTGTVNSIVCTAPNVTAYSNGMVAYVIPAAGNTGPAVINLNGLGGKAITKNGPVPLSGGELRVSVVTHLQYDGMRFHILDDRLPGRTADGSVLTPFPGTTVHVAIPPSGPASVQNVGTNMAKTAGVQDYGAKCDGFTDDKKAFDKAIASGATTLSLPTGTCLIDISGQTGRVFLISASVSFVGRGIGRSIILVSGKHSCSTRCTSYDTTLFTPANNVDLSFSDLSIRGPGNTITSKTGVGITVGYQTVLIYPDGPNNNISLTRVELSNAAFATKSDGGSGINYTLDSCDVSHTYMSAVGVFNSGGNVAITGSTIFHDLGTDTFDHGIYLNMPLASLTITPGVTFRNITGAGILYYESHADGNGPVSILGATFLDCQYAVIFAHTNASYLANVKPAIIDGIRVIGGGVMLDGPNITFANATLIYRPSNPNASVDGIRTGVFAVPSDNMVLRNNLIVGYPQRGISRDVGGMVSAHAVIDTNTISESSRGMLLYKLTDSSITNNTVIPAISGYGFFFAGPDLTRIRMDSNTCVPASGSTCLRLDSTLSSGVAIGGSGNDFSAGSYSIMALGTAVTTWTNTKINSGTIYPPEER